MTLMGLLKVSPIQKDVHGELTGIFQAPCVCKMWGSHSKAMESARRLEKKQETLPKVWKHLRTCPKVTTDPQRDLKPALQLGAQRGQK